MDDRQYLPSKTTQGFWEVNPAFTGNKYDLFKSYPVTLLKEFKNGRAKIKVGSPAFVMRVPSGQLYLSKMANGAVFEMDAVKGIDFK